MSPTITRLTDLAARWDAALERELAPATRLRQELHADPCVSGHEHPATERLLHELRDVAVFDAVADAGAVARIGPAEGASIALRAELDALPVTERTGAPFAATNGAMHACGHDVHQAALVALLRAADGLDLPVGLVALLQPREESYPSGALDVVDAGVLDRFSVAHVIGAHVHPGVPVGAVASGGGFINAAADEIEIRVHGRGGHAAYPHEANDAVSAIAQIALGIPEMVRRSVSPLRPAIISIGTLTAGEGAANVLPAEARIFATMRTTDPADRAVLFAAVQDMAQRTAEAYGTSAVVRRIEGEPALINDATLAASADDWLTRLGVDGAEPMRSLGADDFSYYCDAVPSLMLFAGVATAGKGPQPGLHHPRFLPGDDAIATVARALMAGYLAAAERVLGIEHHRSESAARPAGDSEV
ncbi:MULTISPECIES: M20 metallopeptidase family protein [Microbacterium]|uniref:M20 metallopeptidase family protein n=1 Tax=Microbacterium TaxID=33882 RepID=UPI00217F14C9|nr:MULTISPECIES: amidohydrolase [Microbacterium]UWF77281.1 amidohydrolase [Microbacterium neungamense]WCM55438.1 amidohydrolase [Microbacterium sp. EF45047]